LEAHSSEVPITELAIDDPAGALTSPVRTHPSSARQIGRLLDRKTRRGALARQWSTQVARGHDTGSLARSEQRSLHFPLIMIQAAFGLRETRVGSDRGVGTRSVDRRDRLGEAGVYRQYS
jgi:hypothetical protein